MAEQSAMEQVVQPNFILYRNPAEHPNIKKQLSKEAPWGLEPLGYEYSNGNTVKLIWGSVWTKAEYNTGIILYPNPSRYSGRITLFVQGSNSWVDAQKGLTRFTGLTGIHFPGVAIASAEYRGKRQFLDVLSDYDYKATMLQEEMTIYAHFLLNNLKAAAQLG